jgi:hypothetical protein
LLKETICMNAVIHDLGDEYNQMFCRFFDSVIEADGKYAPCQGCFGCWTKHPAECFMKDSLRYVCRTIGMADNLLIVTKNCYGSYSPEVKNILDRSIGTSTPFSTYRGGQMHHTMRYGRHHLLKVIVYGEATEKEKDTMRLLAERNAVNDGYSDCTVYFLSDLSGLEEALNEDGSY